MRTDLTIFFRNTPFRGGSSVTILLRKAQRDVEFEAGDIPSPRQKSIDETNDRVIKSERGALVTGSDPPYVRRSHEGRWYVAGAGRASHETIFGRRCVENR